jgi:NhaP-type Na+/H+ or K+/H+ antiporter
LLVAAALAPTDAALGLPVVMNAAVPLRVRRLITVESGLNDGIVTPVVMFALAAAVSVEELESAPGLPEALAELGIGVVRGRRCRPRRWIRLAVVAPPGMGGG